MTRILLDIAPHEDGKRCHHCGVRTLDRCDLFGPLDTCSGRRDGDFVRRPLCLAAEQAARQQAAEIEGLKTECAAWRTSDAMQAQEIERLRDVLRECELFLDPAYDDDNFDGIDTMRRKIRCALAAAIKEDK